VGDDVGDTRLYQSTSVGTLSDEGRYAVSGGLSESLGEPRERASRDEMTLPEAVALCARLFAQAENRTIESSDWEGAVLDRTVERRLFRRLDAADFADTG